MADSNPNVLQFAGSNYLRLRLILSILSGKSILIRKIRHKQSESKLGLEDYEVNLLRLIEKVTNGSRIEIDETGTELFFQPGLLNGGKLTHDCNSKRNISYFLEVLLCLAPFTKEPFNIILNGTTNGSMLLSDSTTGHNSELYDASVDCVIASSLPILEKFLGVADGLELKILRRAVLPKSGGKVLFKCPNKAKLRPVQLTEPGKIKKIRGVAFSCKVPPSLANRVGESCKKVLSEFIKDVYITTDHCRGEQSGSSPGYGITLSAHTEEGSVASVDVCCAARNMQNDSPLVPEDVGEQAAHVLFEEIFRAAAVDSVNQSLVFILMAHSPRDVSKVLIGPMTPYAMSCLQHVKIFCANEFLIDDAKSSKDKSANGCEKLLVSCVGSGYANLAKIKR